MFFAHHLHVFSRPAAMAVISLAFGQYILEPLLMPCDIPPMAVKLAAAIGISMNIINTSFRMIFMILNPICERQEMCLSLK